MTDEKLDAYIASCPTHERLRLAGWRSSNDGKRVRYGDVVRTSVRTLLEDEVIIRIIKAPYIYGIVSHEEEYDEPSTLSAWAVN